MEWGSDNCFLAVCRKPIYIKEDTYRRDARRDVTMKINLNSLGIGLYDALGILFIFVAFLMPDNIYHSFVASVLLALALYTPQAVSNLAFTILWARAVVFIFGILFLSPHVIALFTGKAKRGGGKASS